MVGTTTNTSSRFTALLMAFGQFLDHDIGHVPMMEGIPGEDIECCNGDGFPNNMTAEESLVCFPIRIPEEDPVLQNSKSCLNFVRSVGSVQLNCKPGPYQQVRVLMKYSHTSHSILTSNTKYSTIRFIDYFTDKSDYPLAGFF